ncbi:class I SAM-dependent methyltransferase [Kaustia mangrovi]|uniref:Class I SAM-dependent methyltransferase n=1 Tax=Kaustia mangrovi TaxID=2593653 RepID=A0A7S8HBR1_9HYPH|nr:class I SAM-dependent methyltransferase [Kaustia mangrovi]QPC42781.1 class I SAM-dependent methyltransferase [Kaustia mangrovi]
MHSELMEVFASLPQQGPGSDALSRDVMRRLNKELPLAPQIADFGCGTGRSTLMLAEEFPQARISGVDLSPEFCAVLTAKVRERGLGDRVSIHEGNMLCPEFPPGSLDLVWSEGAVYSVGFDAALSAWRELLGSGGICVVTECEWLCRDAPVDARDYWGELYPDMRSSGENAESARRLGFDVLDHFTLPREAWDAYHVPLLDALHGRESLLAAKNDISKEREMFLRYGDYFGYSFYVLKKTPAGSS